MHGFSRAKEVVFLDSTSRVVVQHHIPHSYKVHTIPGSIQLPPPLISEVSIPGPSDSDARTFIEEEHHMLTKLKENLGQEEGRMKKICR